MTKKHVSLSMAEKSTSCCQVVSLISVDERGQMVLPKEFREKAKIQPGDKLALISWEKEGEVCCFTLVKASFLAEGMKELLGSMMKNIFA